MGKPFAYVCTLCSHLATQHRLIPSAADVAGPYACTYEGCGCQITQSTPLTGIWA